MFILSKLLMRILLAYLKFDNCNLTEVIKFLQKLAKSLDASKLNIAFTKHITDALIKAREESLS